MGLKKRKDLEELSDELSDYDFVLTVDEGLSNSLQSQLSNGSIVVTPERLVSEEDYSGSQEMRELFNYIVSETNFTWKQSSYLLNNILECWEKTGEKKKILQYDAFDNEQLEIIFECLEDFNNVYSRLENFKLDENYKVAVIDSYQFNKLQLSVLPEEYNEFSFLTQEETELNGFSIFSSSNQIIEALIDTLSNLNPENTAIVVDKESDYIHSIYASLDAQDIDYVRDKSYSENEDLRDFVNLIELGVSSSRVRYKDLKHLLESEEFMSSKYDNYLFDSLESKEIDKIKEFLNIVDLLSFEEVIEECEELFGTEISYLRDLIELHELKEEKVSLEKLNELKYYIRAFENDYEKEQEGIIFIDPKNPQFTDRENVFYIGLDSDWTKSVNSKPWLKKDEEQEQNIEDFKRLLQLGENQHYLVKDSEGGEEIIPCLYFNEIFDQNYNSFTDFKHQKVRPPKKKGKKGFKRSKQHRKPEKIKTISQSDLNTFVKSPRLFYFSKVARDADGKELTKGNLFHDFAELYVNDPEFVDSKKENYFVEIMYEELEKFIDPSNKLKIKTELLAGIKSLKAYLNSEKIEENDLEGYEPGRDTNIFEKHLDITVDTQVSEMRFEDSELGVKGKVDLIKNNTHLVDYKSGRKYSPKQVFRKSHPKIVDEANFPNFQSILYLTKLRKHQPNEELKFTFFHLLEELEEDINNGTKIDNKKTTITYYPKEFKDIISDIDTFEMLIKDVKKSNDRRKTLEKLNYESYKKIFSQVENVEFFSKEEVMKSEFSKQFIDYARSEVGDYKYVQKGCESALKKLVEFRTSNYFKEDLDDFEEFIKSNIKQLNNYKDQRFPIGEESVDDLPNRDLMVIESYESE